jgi:hypothetical protein
LARLEPKRRHNATQRGEQATRLRTFLPVGAQYCRRNGGSANCGIVPAIAHRPTPIPSRSDPSRPPSRTASMPMSSAWPRPPTVFAYRRRPERRSDDTPRSKTPSANSGLTSRTRGSLPNRLGFDEMKAVAWTSARPLVGRKANVRLSSVDCCNQTVGKRPRISRLADAQGVLRRQSIIPIRRKISRNIDGTCDGIYIRILTFIA